MGKPKPEQGPEKYPPGGPTTAEIHGASSTPMTPKEILVQALEERKERIGALRNAINNTIQTVQELIGQDERIMGIYHRELFPEDIPKEEKKTSDAQEPDRGPEPKK